MHAQHPGIAARWDKEQKGKGEMPKKSTGPKTVTKPGGATVTRTVARKAAVNYNAGAKATPERGSKANLMRRGASVNPDLTRKAVRTTIKAGLRSRKPDLSSKQVKGRAEKQTAAFMKKRAK